MTWCTTALIATTKQYGGYWWPHVLRYSSLLLSSMVVTDDLMYSCLLSSVTLISSPPAFNSWCSILPRISKSVEKNNSRPHSSRLLSLSSTDRTRHLWAPRVNRVNPNPNPNSRPHSSRLLSLSSTDRTRHSSEHCQNEPHWQPRHYTVTMVLLTVCNGEVGIL